MHVNVETPMSHNVSSKRTMSPTGLYFFCDVFFLCYVNVSNAKSFLNTVLDYRPTMQLQDP